jgi:hypothetical protein
MSIMSFAITKKPHLKGTIADTLLTKLARSRAGWVNWMEQDSFP